MNFFKWFSGSFILFFATVCFAIDAPDENDPSSQITQYIHQSWDKLTRNNHQLIFSKIDTKIAADKLYLYIPKKENLTKIRQELHNTEQSVIINYLPDNISSIKNHGLLYLPYPYIVPGGRFNEMYGWDSYFIELGLLNENRIVMAKNMIANLIYEIENYGTILNANRSYYLERSHPPLLTEMILAYYNKTHDKNWLRTTLPALIKLYQYWMTPPRYISSIGLSRYYAGGNGPTPEESPKYYEQAIAYFQHHEIPDYDKSLYFDAKNSQLKPLFFVADRALRESGFDITEKYGPFGASILDYAPVDLNVLLYEMEKEMGDIYLILDDSKAAKLWQERASKRLKLINQYMWDNKLGLYFDYNFKNHSLRHYVFATTFYPMWAGIATKEQAQKIMNNISQLLAPGGIVSSIYASKVQWDAPFGWAPFQYFTVLGLDRYGYKELARETAQRFVNTVNTVFGQTHQLFEKYDVQHSSMQTLGCINYGYDTNEVGFGWTNGVYLQLITYLKIHANENKN